MFAAKVVSGVFMIVDDLVSVASAPIFLKRFLETVFSRKPAMQQ